VEAETPAANLPEHAYGEDAADRHALGATIRQALIRLPQQQRTVLVLRYYADLPEAEVADILGCATGTVKTHAPPGTARAARPARRRVAASFWSTRRQRSGVARDERVMKEELMYDTEEARRLLGAAAEDIPADANLLDGVRKRQGAHRVRARAALGATAAGAVAVATVVAVSATQAPSALAAVTSAVSRTSAQSYRATMTYSSTLTPGKNSGRAYTISGKFDVAQGIGEENDGKTLFVGDDSYEYTGPSGPGGKSWLKVPLPRLAGTSNPAAVLLIVSTLPAEVSPVDLLMLLKSVSQVRETGSASGPGWTGTGYAFTYAGTAGPPLALPAPSPWTSKDGYASLTTP
jgi:hypothetical protein